MSKQAPAEVVLPGTDSTSLVLFAVRMRPVPLLLLLPLQAAGDARRLLPGKLNGEVPAALVFAAMLLMLLDGALDLLGVCVVMVSFSKSSPRVELDTTVTAESCTLPSSPKDFSANSRSACTLAVSSNTLANVGVTVFVRRAIGLCVAKVEHASRYLSADCSLRNVPAGVSKGRSKTRSIQTKRSTTS